MMVLKIVVDFVTALRRMIDPNLLYFWQLNGDAVDVVHFDVVDEAEQNTAQYDGTSREGRGSAATKTTQQQQPPTPVLGASFIVLHPAFAAGATRPAAAARL